MATRFPARKRASLKTEVINEKLKTRRKIMRMLVCFIVLATSMYGQEGTPDHRLRTSSAVLNEIMSTPDKGIPEELLSKAQCIVIVPGLKRAAFVVGGEYGRGFAVCRNSSGWGARSSPLQRRELGSSNWRRVNGRRNACDEPPRYGKAGD